MADMKQERKLQYRYKQYSDIHYVNPEDYFTKWIDVPTVNLEDQVNV